jgi:hypothetical protein
LKKHYSTFAIESSRESQASMGFAATASQLRGVHAIMFYRGGSFSVSRDQFFKLQFPTPCPL